MPVSLLTHFLKQLSTQNWYPPLFSISNIQAYSTTTLPSWLAVFFFSFSYIFSFLSSHHQHWHLLKTKGRIQAAKQWISICPLFALCVCTPDCFSNSLFHTQATNKNSFHYSTKSLLGRRELDKNEKKNPKKHITHWVKPPPSSSKLFQFEVMN